jgi:hypothetical protein
METFVNITFNSMFLDVGNVISNLQMPVLRDEEILRGLNAPRSQSAVATPDYTFPSLQLPNLLLDNPVNDTSPPQAVPEIPVSWEEPVTETRQQQTMEPTAEEPREPLQPPVTSQPVEASQPSASQPTEASQPAVASQPSASQPTEASQPDAASQLQQAPPLQVDPPPAEAVATNAPFDEEGLEPPLYNPFLD